MSKKVNKSSYHRCDIHHRRMRSHGGDDSPENISIVNCVQHRAFHILFKNMTPYEIARLLNDVWIDPRYFFKVEKV
jgi:hypothetical protein